MYGFHELFVSLDVAWILCIYVLPKIQIYMDVLPKIQICVDVLPKIQICVDVSRSLVTI
jgi:hypothetical protein